MRSLVRYFLQGCLVVVPAVFTAYAVYLIVRKADALLRGPVPGVGIAVAILGITLVGALASNILGRTLVRLLERLIGRVPVVRVLYGTVRDLLAAFLGERRSFERPVLVSLSADGELKLLGFVTREDLSDLGLTEHVMVYLPQSYNFAGNLLVVPRSRVKTVSVDAAQFMTLVVSGGVARGNAARSGKGLPPS